MFENIFRVFVLFILVLLPGGNTQPEDTAVDSTEVQSISYKDCLTLVNEYPHNRESFTQGLFFYGGEMYETTGRYGTSKLYKNINAETGEAEVEYAFSDDIFAEGSAVYDGKLYVLTYKENQVLVFDPETLELETTYDYPRQGWGLTTDSEYLISSDGSSKLYFMDGNLNDVYTLDIKLNGEDVNYINELEYINGDIWANIWLTNDIIIIDKNSGNVKRVIDFSGLYTPKTEDRDAVLNGIAYNPDNGNLYITGKLWDRIFEFEIKN